MKKLFTKPGFEFIFALSIITVMCLPLLVFSQSRNLTISINNGDTVINGKNIKDLSAAERKQALKDIEGFGSAMKMDHQHFFRWKDDKSDTSSNRVFTERIPFEGGDMGDAFRWDNDTTKHNFKFRFRTPDGKDSMFTFNYRGNPGREFRFEPRKFFRNPEFDFDMPVRGRGFDMMHRRNSQSFSYTNTGNDGMTTHISFRVSDASAAKTKEITGSEKNGLELKDLNLVPEFSSGKTTLMFSLSSVAAADVKLTDSDGKLVWSSKVANGSFSKSFTLGLNGVYFLEVKQGGKTALKRIVKEE